MRRKRQVSEVHDQQHMRAATKRRAQKIQASRSVRGACRGERVAATQRGTANAGGVRAKNSIRHEGRRGCV